MKRCFASLGVLAALFVCAQSATAGDKQEIAFTATLVGAQPPETHVTPDGVVRTYFPAVYNQINFITWPFSSLTGQLTWEGTITSTAEVSVGSGTGILETPDGVFLTKWHFRQHAGELFTLTAIGVGIDDLEGLWFEATGEGLSPYAPYTCVGTLMNPKATQTTE